MNDYSMGAMEALSWARSVLKQCSTLEGFKEARDEINRVLLKLAGGAAVDFKEKAELLSDF